MNRQHSLTYTGGRLFPETGTPQGGALSPLLANIASHGFEMFVSRNARQHRVVVILEYASPAFATPG